MVDINTTPNTLRGKSQYMCEEVKRRILATWRGNKKRSVFEVDTRGFVSPNEKSNKSELMELYCFVIYLVLQYGIVSLKLFLFDTFLLLEMRKPNH